MDRRYDLAIVLVLIAVGVFVIAVARTIPAGLHRDAVGSRAFFFGVGILFFVGGFILATQRIVRWRAQKDHMVPMEGTEDEEGQPVSALRPAIIVGISIAYVALFNPLGYLLSTPLFIVGALAVLGERKWWRLILLAVSFTVIFYIIFAQVLNTRMSVGPLAPLFRELGWIYN